MVEFYLKHCRCYRDGKIETGDFYIRGGRAEPAGILKSGLPVVSGEGKLLAPAFCDLHAHLREPGFSYKETIASGTRAAARGGFSTVCAMPNLLPVPDTEKAISEELTLIERDAVIEVLPYAAITKGENGKELSDIAALSKYCCGYSDDGKGVQDGALMKSAMAEIAALGGFVAAHTEDETKLIPGGAVHGGAAARRFGVPGMSPAAEYAQIERDLRLAEKTGCRYHVCHVSAKESVELLRKAKQKGLPVTCEATPHHLALTEEDITEDSGRFKMNPPLRAAADRAAVLEGIRDGTVDCIATDHAPHSPEEKSGGLAGSAMGTVGLETAFSVCNTYLVKAGIIGYPELFRLLAGNPRKILSRPTRPGWVLLDTETMRKVDSARFLSCGRSTPFDGKALFGGVLLTSAGGRIVYADPEFLGD